MEKMPSYDLPEDELAHIASYLSGEMEPNEANTFEKRLGEEPGLRSKVVEVEALLLGVREANLRQQLEVYHADVGQGDGRTLRERSRPYRQWWVAASVAFFVLLGGWWIWFSAPSNERLYRDHFLPDIGLPVEMSASDTAEYLFYDGMINYKEGNYTDALAKWSALAKANGTTDTLHYYMGLSHMALGDFGMALEELAPVANERRSAFYREATWYLALCYVKGDRRQTAVALLKRLPDDPQARELLKKLE